MNTVKELDQTAYNHLNQLYQTDIAELTARAEKAEAELQIVYGLADNMANGTHDAVQAYNDWVHAGELVAEEEE